MRGFVVILGAALVLAAPGQKPASPGPPAQLDPSTPRAQTGYTLIAIQRAGKSGECFARLGKGQVYTETIWQGADATALWIRTPLTPTQSMATPGRRVVQELFAITARLSNGDTLPLEWRTRYARDPNLIFTYLPPGYPNTVRYTDVTIKDRRGGVARWRLTHLPEMRQTIAQPGTVKDSAQEAGISVKGSAWQNAPAAPSIVDRSITYELKASGQPSGPFHWELVCEGALNQWEAPGYDIHSTGVSSQPLDPKLGAIATVVRAAPYAAHDRFGIVRGALRQFDTYDERVIFHNIPIVNAAHSAMFRITRAQTARTPSGITVTLPVQNASPSHRDVTAGMANGLNIVLSVRPAAETALARSPLFQKHKRPVRIQVLTAPPYETVMWSGTGARRELGVRLKKPLTGVLKDFTLLVRQRVNLRQIPIELTVPVSDKPPF